MNTSKPEETIETTRYSYLMVEDSSGSITPMFLESVMRPVPWMVSCDPAADAPEVDAVIVEIHTQTGTVPDMGYLSSPRMRRFYPNGYPREQGTKGVCTAESKMLGAKCIIDNAHQGRPHWGPDNTGRYHQWEVKNA